MGTHMGPDTAKSPVFGLTFLYCCRTSLSHGWARSLVNHAAAPVVLHPSLPLGQFCLLYAGQSVGCRGVWKLTRTPLSHASEDSTGPPLFLPLSSNAARYTMIRRARKQSITAETHSEPLPHGIFKSVNCVKCICYRI